MSEVIIDHMPVGDSWPVPVIAELGINHNGSMIQALALIEAAQEAGATAVKFQKRTVDTVYSPEELARPRESPFGTTNGDLKRGLELGLGEYEVIAQHCRITGMPWFASCWDEAAVDFIARFDPPCFKIASACLTDDNLLRYHRKYQKPIVLSTGLSTIKQIDHAFEVLGRKDLILMHCVGVYPARSDQLNLKCIETLRQRYGVPVGYSGHEVGLATTVAAVAMGARIVERHLTLDRAMFGSDQSASVEPQGFKRLVRDIREVGSALGTGQKEVLAAEKDVIAKLRRVDTAGLGD